MTISVGVKASGTQVGVSVRAGVTMLPSGLPAPNTVTSPPREPTPGDVADDSAARPPIGSGEGPHLPTTAELMWHRYQMALAQERTTKGST